jgi:hypothetical protein
MFEHASVLQNFPDAESSKLLFLLRDRAFGKVAQSLAPESARWVGYNRISAGELVRVARPVENFHAFKMAID